MKKENTLQEVQIEIDELEGEKESYEIQLLQLKNREKMLVKLANEKERKRRHHRLIGSETASTRRSRKSRGQKALQSGTSATSCNILQHFATKLQRRYRDRE